MDAELCRWWTVLLFISMSCGFDEAETSINRLYACITEENDACHQCTTASWETDSETTHVMPAEHLGCSYHRREASVAWLDQAHIRKH
jgi:hypothetical protein